MNNKTQPTTDTIEARAARIARRKQIIDVLINPHWLPLKLVQLGLEGNEPIQIDLHFTGQNFPGQYTYRILELLRSLQEAGLVKLNQIRDTTSYEVCIEDEVTKEFIKALFD